jgi:hypothetical protein
VDSSVDQLVDRLDQVAEVARLRVKSSCNALDLINIHSKTCHGELLLVCVVLELPSAVPLGLSVAFR